MAEKTAKQTVFLRSQADWEDWEHQFLLQAENNNVEEHVDPKTKTGSLQKPKFPELKDYP